MTEKKVDLRIIRSKNAIRDAFVQLIEEKGFGSITVKDITTKAGINRGTFYTHYDDKHDLMAQCQEDLMNGMYEIAKVNIPNINSENETKDDNAESNGSHAVTIFEYIDEHRVIFKALLCSHSNTYFQQKLRDFLWKTLFDDDEHSIFKKENLLAPEEYLASYIASAHIGVIQQWLENDNAESPKEMAKILSLITMQGPFVAAGFNVKK